MALAHNGDFNKKKKYATILYIEGKKQVIKEYA